MRRKLLAPIILIAFLVSACSTSQWLISGEVIDQVGKQFVVTGTMYNELIDSSSITPEEYNAWAEFAVKFKTVYPRVVDTWVAATSAQEAGDAADAIKAVKDELLLFYLSALNKKGGGV